MYGKIKIVQTLSFLHGRYFSLNGNYRGFYVFDIFGIIAEETGDENG